MSFYMLNIYGLKKEDFELINNQISKFSKDKTRLNCSYIKDFDFNLKKLWFSKRSNEVRKKIKKNKCFCTYECAMTSNTLFNLRHLFHILTNSFRKKPLSK